LPALLALFLTSAVEAETLHSSLGAAATITAGYFCHVDPDDIIDAPRTDNNELNVYNDPFGFVELSDRVPSLRGMGIGAVVQLENYQAGEELLVTVVHGDPCCGPPESWLATPTSDGVFWFGYLGGLEDKFEPGEWRFSVTRGTKLLLTYAIYVDQAEVGPNGVKICTNLNT